MSSEPGREDDEDAARHVYFEHGMYSPGGSDSSAEANEEAVLRHMQLMRGAVSTKMVASKSTLRSLESVKIEDIPEGDRSRQSRCRMNRWYGEANASQAVSFATAIMALKVLRVFASRPSVFRNADIYSETTASKSGLISQIVAHTAVTSCIRNPNSTPAPLRAPS